MSSWLQALHLGHIGKRKIRFFYISNSPRNYFGYLTKFLEINQFPKDPVLPKDWGRKGEITKLDHKEEEIKRLFLTSPDLPFILLGDIAGDDPILYHAISKKYPKQILSIYIREIKHKRR